ncbi:MAG: sulfite oxidase-like oxidoreductase [Aigarchaeota archaeon]|nr:sulfite oxidase-like oxidoreductase [Aigarchaeota archaeon]MDW8093102.1 sulfite oxidase-like oxidoreductase [Nitrososphaerota archaeon]
MVRVEVQSSVKELPPGQRLVRRFIIYAALGVPSINPDEWRLRVGGLVDRELEFTYENLVREAPNVTLKRDFHCVTGWSVADVTWEGVPLRWFAERAGVKPEAEWVMFGCADGYTSIITLEDALSDDAIVALKIDGKLLSIEQGFPARPFIPHLYGWKSAKWLTEIEFMKHYVDGYWELYGYHEVGEVWREERFKSGSGRHVKRSPLRVT